MLDAVIALPDQLFYNTAIYTYIWIITNRKNDGSNNTKNRRGKVQLINGTDFAWKMKKSLGDKRKKIGVGENGEPDHIDLLTKIYANFKKEDTRKLSQIKTNVELPKKRVRDHSKVITVGKVFKNQDFGYLKIVVERPLRLNFAVTEERMTQLTETSYFINLAKSKKRKDKRTVAKEIAAGEQQQAELLEVLRSLKSKFKKDKLIKNRDEFDALLKAIFASSDIRYDSALKKALLAPGSLAEKDPTAEICTDSKGNPESDGELRDTENVPLPPKIALPLPLAYENKKENKGKVDKTELLAIVQQHCEDYLTEEVLPYRPDAWIDHSKIKVGYEIPFNRHFYEYEPPRELSEIEKDIKGLEREILEMLAEVV